MNSFHRWFDDITLSDPIEQRQASLLQYFLLGVMALALISLPIPLFMLRDAASRIVGSICLGLMLLCVVAALVLLRRGLFRASVTLAAIGLVAAIAAPLFGNGSAQGGSAIVFGLVLPIAIAGLASHRGTLLLVFGLANLVVFAVVVFEQAGSPLVGFAQDGRSGTYAIATSFLIITALLSIFLERFNSSLRTALKTALSRERELEYARANLEDIVSERTASLQNALQTVEQRETTLQQTLDDLQVTQSVVRDLSAPVIPVLPGVLIVPVVGELGSERADVMTENTLAVIEQQSSRYVIFDITGVPVVDTYVGKVLLGLASSVRLLGAQAILVGVRPEVAQTVVALGLDFNTLVTYASLQEAVLALIADQRVGSNPGNRG